MDKKEFRKDINSLRAIAVISVIFFHFFYNIDEEYSFTIPFLSDYFSVSIFQAGYLGVDIFFVVSGFLMTKIIVTGLDKNSFSVWKFWKARAKRICPALFFMLCLFGIFAYIFFSSEQLTKYVRQSQWALLFLSNLRFASRTDYFAENDLLSNLLLHCWSLSVEWQFYILYPFLLIVISKYFKNWRLKILCLLFVASFITSLFLVPNSAYYYLQSRAWELLAGGIVFLLPQNKWQWLDKKSCIVLFLFVLVICLSPKDWNSLSALLIVLLTSLVIYINKKDSFLFNSKVVQYLGKISYSLYLYHWPVVCFYTSIFSFSFYGFLFALLIIFLLSSVSYFLIERTRNYGWLMLIAYIIFGLFVTLEASKRGTLIKDQFIIHIKNVYVNSAYKNDLVKIKEGNNIIVYENNLNKELPKKDTKVLLVGDSNARHYATFFINNFNTYYSLALDGTVAYSQSIWKGRRSEEDRNTYLNDFESFLRENCGVTVFLSNRWTQYFLEKNNWKDHERVLKDLDEVLGKIIKENLDDKFIIVGVSPILPNHIISSLSLENALQEINLSFNFREYSEFDKKLQWRELNELLQDYFIQFSNVIYISPLDIMCKNKKCRIYDNEGNLLFFDITHFSKYGSNFIEPYLLEAYKKVNDKR